MLAATKESEAKMNWKTLAQNRAAIKPNMVIVGIDIAKKWHFARIVYPDGRFAPSLRFYNDLQGFTHLLEYIRRHQQLAGCDDAIIGFESTGHYWMNLVHWLDRKGCRLVQVNPLYVKRSRDMLDNSPSGSDPKSALTIATMIAEGKYLKVVLPKGTFADLRELVAMRDRLMAERNAKLNLLNAVVDRLFPEFTDVFKDLKCQTARYVLVHYPSPADILRPTAAELTDELRRNCLKNLSLKRVELLQAKARDTVGLQQGSHLISAALIDVLKAVESLNDRIGVLEVALKKLVQGVDESKYLLGLKGIGLITAAMLLGETGGFRNYDHAQAVLKLAGLNVYVVKSGTWEGAHRIARRGRALLRKTLYLAALRLIRKGMALHDFYSRLVSRGKRKKKAVVAAACRLVRILYALVRDRRSYSEQWSPLRPQVSAA
jgi:transposase